MLHSSCKQIRCFYKASDLFTHELFIHKSLIGLRIQSGINLDWKF